MSNPKISVITPLYNRKDLIEETINSILAQDYNDFELLIIDDGSTDGSGDLVKKYLNDGRVRYIYRENSGEANTVNFGWEISRGEYFTQVNSDDPILPNLFKRMVERLDEDKEAAVAYPDFYIIDQDGHIVSETKSPDWDFVSALQSYSCYPASPGTFIRKSSFKDWIRIKNPNYKYINDTVMYWDMALEKKFIHVPEFLANWRVHKNSISNTRYMSIPECELWFKEYFSKPNLPLDVKRSEKKTERSMYMYFIQLLKDSDSTDKYNKISQYREKIENLYLFKNLQVGDNDLIGNKFNGHDLHIYLRDREIDSYHLVWNKESNDENTFRIAEGKRDRDIRSKLIRQIKTNYCLDNVWGTDSLDIIYNRLFLDSDIVHLHLIHNMNFDINLLPIMSKLKPIVWTLHDPWALSGHCIHHFDCDRWKSGCGDCPYLNIHFPLSKDNTALNYEIKYQAITNSKLDIIVASKWVKKQIETSPMFNNARIHLIPFGINQDIFKPMDKAKIRKKLGIAENAIVFAGRCDYSEFKGFDYIEYIVDNLKSKGQEYVLLLFGSKYRKDSGNVKIIEYGWVKDDKLMAEIYNACDLFLMPSIVDTFGMMAIEAMSCGRVPVVLEGTAIPDVIGSPEYGVAVKKDKKEYLNTVLNLINNPKERSKREEMCLKYAKKRYSYEKYIDNIINVYKNAIKEFKLEPKYKFILKQLRDKMQIDPWAEVAIEGLPSLEKADSLFQRINKRLYRYYDALLSKLPLQKSILALNEEISHSNKLVEEVEKDLYNLQYEYKQTSSRIVSELNNILREIEDSKK